MNEDKTSFIKIVCFQLRNRVLALSHQSPFNRTTAVLIVGTMLMLPCAIPIKINKAINLTDCLVFESCGIKGAL